MNKRKGKIIKLVLMYFDFDFKNFEVEERVFKNGKILSVSNDCIKNSIKQNNKLKVESKLNSKLSAIMNKEVLYQYYNSKARSLSHFLSQEKVTNLSFAFERKITKISIYNHEKLIIGLENGEISLINFKNNIIEKTYNDQTSRIINIKSLPENNLFFAASNDGLLRVYNIMFASCINTIEYIGIYCNMEICNINNKKNLIIGSQNGNIEVYTIAGWKLEYEIQIKNSFITCTKFVSIYNWLIVGNFEGELILIQLETKEKMAEYHRVHKGLINFIYLLKDYFFLSISSEDNLIVLWNVTNEESMKVWDFTNIMLKNINPKSTFWNEIEYFAFESKNEFYEYYSYKFKTVSNIVNCHLLDNNYLILINNRGEIFSIDFKNNEIFNKIKEQELKIKSRNMDNHLPLKEVVELVDSENLEENYNSKSKKCSTFKIKFNDKKELVEYYVNNTSINYKSYCNFLNRLRLSKVKNIPKVDFSKNDNHSEFDSKLNSQSKTELNLINDTNMIIHLEMIDIETNYKNDNIKSLRSLCIVNSCDNRKIHIII